MTDCCPPLPEAFTLRMKTQLGPDTDAFLAALAAPHVRGLRLNPRKLLFPMEEPTGLLAPIPWEPNGYGLAQDSGAGAHPLHEAGAYYLQEPTAMIPARVLSPRPGERVLDLCAAPGGKATQLAEMLEGQGLLVANEPVPSRAQVLARNVERMGVACALLTCAQPETLAKAWPDVFDAVLVDAPCSGEGMFRRHPETRLEWNAGSPAGCAARQKRILASAYAMLAPGGRLVYSTCTFSPEENEQVIAWFVNAYGDMEPAPFFVPTGDGQCLSSTDGMLRLYPHQVAGEGHFVALLRKRGDGPIPAKALPFHFPGHSLQHASKVQLEAYESFRQSFPEQTFPVANGCLGNTLLAAPPLPSLSGIKVYRAGVHLGTLKGKVFAPDHALALALCPPYGMPCVPLTLVQSVLYQQGETLPLPGAPTGYALMTYGGLALGFAKGSDGQLKNHYPKGLRHP